MQEPLDSNSPKNQPAKEGAGSPKQSAVITDVVPTPPTDSKSENCKCCHTPWWKTTAEMVGIAAVVIYTVVSCNQWKTAQKQIEMTERPWVNVDLRFTTPLTATINDIRIAAEAKLKNVGRTPAGRLQTWVDFLPSEPKDVMAERQRVCSIAAGIQKNSPEVTDTLFPEPNTDLPKQWVLHFDKPNSPTEPLKPTAIVCVVYGSTFGSVESIYETAKVIYIRTLDAQGNAAPIDPQKLPIPLQQLGVFPAFVGANYAK